MGSSFWRNYILNHAGFHWMPAKRMRLCLPITLLILAGCSSHPGANFLDAFFPGRLQLDPKEPVRGGVCIPQGAAPALPVTPVVPVPAGPAGPVFPGTVPTPIGGGLPPEPAPIPPPPPPPKTL